MAKSKFSPALAESICLRMAEGESLRKICLDKKMPDKATVMRWLDSNKDFRDQYARARELQADLLVDQMLEIADTPQEGVKTKVSDDGTTETTTGDMIEHRRLRVDVRKWYAGKVAPKKYGDKLALGGAEDLGPMQFTEVVRTIVRPDHPNG